MVVSVSLLLGAVPNSIFFQRMDPRVDSEQCKRYAAKQSCLRRRGFQIPVLPVFRAHDMQLHGYILCILELET